MALLRNIAVGAMKAAPWLESVATALRLPEFGISEQAAGWRPTQYTGFSAGREDPGMLAWKNIHFIRGSGATTPVTPVGGGSTSGGGGNRTSPPISSPQPQNVGQPNPHDYIYDPNLNMYRKWQDIQREQQERENRIRSQIEGTYSNIIRRLDELAGLYPQYQQEDIASLEKSMGSIKTGLEQALQGEQQKLASYRRDVETRKKQGLEEISQNLRNLMRATGMQLGAMGAGSSSAAEVVMPYALGKQAARAGAQVIRGANEQLAELDRKEVDVRTTYNTQIAEVDRQAEEQRQAIIERYRQMKAAIDQAKINADEEKMKALTALDSNLMDVANAKLSQIEYEQRMTRQTIEDWARNRIAQLQDMKIALTQSAAFSPQQLTYEALQGLRGFAPYGAGEEFYNPYIVRRRREELGY